MCVAIGLHLLLVTCLEFTVENIITSIVNTSLLENTKKMALMSYILFEIN